VINPRELEHWIRQQGIPGAAFSQINAVGEIKSFAEGYCKIDHTNDEPVTIETSFQLASVSKFMTACLVLELSKQRIIDLYEPLQWQPCNRSSITTTTFSTLLRHRGGFSKNIGFAGQEKDQVGIDFHINEVETCGSHYQENMRGFYLYSGCNYWLIQRLLEQKLDRSFDSLLQGWICQPFGLNRTSCEAPNPSIHSVACGHDHAGQIINGGWRTFKGVEAAAGIWSTANDIGHFLKQLMERNIHTSGRRSMLKLTDLVIEGQATGYHYGVLVNQSREGLLLRHHGVNPGYQAVILIDLGASVASTLLINKERCDALLDILKSASN
jgi:CubicO group peptidase (beta-lactamase class C family)